MMSSGTMVGEPSPPYIVVRRNIKKRSSGKGKNGRCRHHDGFARRKTCRVAVDHSDGLAASRKATFPTERYERVELNPVCPSTSRCQLAAPSPDREPSHPGCCAGSQRFLRRWSRLAR